PWGTWLTFVATTAAFAAAAYYAHIARKTFDQIKIQTQAIAGVDHAKIYAAYVQHNDGDFWIVGFRNVGRVAAPTLTVTYSIVLFDFNRGQTIQTFETGKFTSAEVVPS